MLTNQEVLAMHNVKSSISKNDEVCLLENEGIIIIKVGTKIILKEQLIGKESTSRVENSGG